ncbi:FAD:protein FMN transferase [Roseateles sp.]|uniref:FAD:protein FMN transferase n=1 Tax=Roseateles sp. TaxID=1971397 RepID=UPI003BA7317B
MQTLNSKAAQAATQAACPPRCVLMPRDIDPAGPLLGEELYQLQGRSMGTSWCVKFYGPRGLGTQAVQAGLEDGLAEVVARMSPWETESDLNRFARTSSGAWLNLSQSTWEVLGHALQVARASGGAFDPTAAALVRAWGFGAGKRHDEPGFVEPEEPAWGERLGQALSWQDLTLREASRELWQPGELELDFCGIAKGYAVDRLSAFLLACGLPHHLVEVGGELRGCGRKLDGQPWWVQLESVPDSWGLPESVLALHGLSVATSGDYRRSYVDVQGQRRSHTLDPRRRAPVAHGLASVSVVHSSCCLADAWATALLVLGPQAGPALATQQGLAALFVIREEGPSWEHPHHGEPHWREVQSPALRAMVCD